MPLWLWLVDSLALIVVVGLIVVIGLVLRRRWISRQGVAFDMSVNRGVEASAKGWLLGTAVYRESEIDWYRTFSVSPRPKFRFPRGEVLIEGRRDPVGAEIYALHDGHVVVSMEGRTPIRQLAMTPNSLTGLLSWLESSPPGRGVSTVV